MKRFRFFSLFTLAFCLFSIAIRAQTDSKMNDIGVNAGVQWGNGLGARPAFGISYGRQISPHSGFETGVSYLNLRVATLQSNTSLNASNDYYHLLTLPLLYRLHSNIVDVAAGPTLNVLTGPSRTNLSSVSFRKEPGSIAIGYAAKISKPILLNNNLLLVPDAGIHGNQYFKKPQGAANIGLRYRF